MARLRRVWLGLLLLTLANFGALAASPKRVLILDPFGRDVAPFNIAVSSFRTTLARELGEPVDIYELPLELARFAEPEGEIPLVTFLEGRLKEHPVDLVVPIGTGGMQFAARHRERLFLNTPILVVGAEPRMVSPDFLRANATLVTQKASLPGMVEDILTLQPETTNIVVVFGASTLERFWVDVCRREFQVFTNRVGFTWLNHLSLDQMLQQCAALPPRSFILHGLFVVDAVGVPCERNEALRRLHEVANAPVFAYYASELGLGSIGGRLYQDVEVGVQGARTAIRILRGESAGSIPPQVFEEVAPVFDWRELHRWGISEATLPADSTIQFRQVGFWERYRWLITGAVLFCLLQAALIVGLLVNRAKRRQAEAEATLIADVSSKFVNLPPSEVYREIIDAQRRICELLGLEVSSLWQWSPEAPEVLTLTHLYRLLDGPPTPEPMSANEHFPWCQRELLAGRIVMLSSLEQLPAEAARDRTTFGHFGIKSGLIVPLSVGGGPPVGALSFGTVQKERGWPASLVKRLQQVAEIFTNALARKRAEQALRESEERMTLAADAAQFGVWGWNIARNQIWGSERWLRLFGFPSGEHVNFQNVIQRIHPDHRETVEREVARAVANRNDYAGEFRAILPDGTQRWIASQGRGYQDANGVTSRMLGAAFDITERKRAEDEVRQLSLAVEQSPVSVVITDLQGKMTYVNRKFSELSGYTFEECIGQNPRILKSGECTASTYRELWSVITGGGTWRGEFHNRKKNGELYWEWAVISPLLDATGKVTHFVGVKEDITERKRVEEALRDLSRRLIRAHEEERARLARDLHDDVTQRLARLAIDAGRAEHGSDENSRAETMRSVRDGLVSLSEDVHSLSYRLHPSVLEDLGLAEALKSECERFSRQESTYAEVDVGNVPNCIPPESALCLFRVAQEALRNVARHARARRVKVSVRALDGGLQLAVADDGIGFETALQRDRSSLGLASMRERVHLLDGELDIESAPGQGTTILVWVPLKGESL